MAQKLTDTIVKNAKPKDKRYTLFDTGGLYLEVAPNGSRWWRFRYTLNRKTRTVSLGVYPDVSLKNARIRRDAARTLLANGGDPAKERKKPKNLPSFEDVANEWFLMKRPIWAPGHSRTVKLRLDKYLVPNLSDRPMADLATGDFLRIMRALEATGKYETCKRVAQLCGQICRFAKLSGITASCD